MRIAIVGGDMRMVYAARGFIEEGAQVTLSGFDGLKMPFEIDTVSVEEAVSGSDIIVLPVRPPKDSAPFYMRLGELSGGRPVFSGSADSIRGFFKGNVYDYSAREELCVYNAVLTAEGAVQLAMSEYVGSVFGSRVLVTGYGRIGRILCRYLRTLGVDVTVAVRSIQAEAWARAEGLNTCDYSLKELNGYDLIFNTVPAPVLSASKLDTVRPDSLIIDLASAPGGVDFKRAGERGLRAIHALGLPGKTAPKAAGRIIKDTIIKMIKEENGGKDYLGLRDDRLLLHL